MNQRIFQNVSKHKTVPQIEPIFSLVWNCISNTDIHAINRETKKRASNWPVTIWKSRTSPYSSSLPCECKHYGQECSNQICNKSTDTAVAMPLHTTRMKSTGSHYPFIHFASTDGPNFISECGNNQDNTKHSRNCGRWSQTASSSKWKAYSSCSRNMAFHAEKISGSQREHCPFCLDGQTTQPSMYSSPEPNDKYAATIPEPNTNCSNNVLRPCHQIVANNNEYSTLTSIFNSKHIIIHHPNLE